MRRERGLEYDPAEDGGGSFDEGDPSTTNLYVGNLAPDVDEEAWASSCSGPIWHWEFSSVPFLVTISSSFAS